MFCIYLRTNSDLCHLQHKLIGFYNRDEKCLQRGTDWVFKCSSLRFVCKGLNTHSSTAFNATHKASGVMINYYHTINTQSQVTGYPI